MLGASQVESCCSPQHQGKHVLASEEAPIACAATRDAQFSSGDEGPHSRRCAIAEHFGHRFDRQQRGIVAEGRVIRDPHDSVITRCVLIQSSSQLLLKFGKLGEELPRSSNLIGDGD